MLVTEEESSMEEYLADAKLREEHFVAGYETLMDQTSYSIVVI